MLFDSSIKAFICLAIIGQLVVPYHAPPSPLYLTATAYVPTPRWSSSWFPITHWCPSMLEILYLLMLCWLVTGLMDLRCMSYLDGLQRLTTNRGSTIRTPRLPTYIIVECILHPAWTLFCIRKVALCFSNHYKHKEVVGSSCLVHSGVQDKRRVSEIDLTQPRHETAFWWRHNGPVTSQSTDPIKWPNYPSELIGIYMHINTHDKESLTQKCRRSTNLQLCLIFCIYLYGLSLNGRHVFFCITNNRHDVTITTHANMDDDGETAYETPMFLCFNLKIHLYLCLLVNETKNPQHLDCGRPIRRSLVWNRFIPHSLQVSIYHIKV